MVKNLNIIKRDGSIVKFNKCKIEDAILKAMKYGSGIYEEEIAKKIADEIEISCFEKENSPTVYQVENMVYNKLIEYKHELTAKAYEGYRAVQSFKREVNTTDDSIIGLLNKTNEEVINENSNIYNNLKEIFLKIIQVYSHKYYGFELEIKALLFSFFANIFRENLVIKKDSILSDDSKVFKIKDVIKYIENNYRNDINITTLANICHYNEYHFMRFFKKYTGKTCIQFIKNYRLEKAYNLLKNTDLPVTQISFDVGFSNVSYFIRSFKEKYKVTPKELRLRADDSFNV